MGCVKLLSSLLNTRNEEIEGELVSLQVSFRAWRTARVWASDRFRALYGGRDRTAPSDGATLCPRLPFLSAAFLPVPQLYERVMDCFFGCAANSMLAHQVMEYVLIPLFEDEHEELIRAMLEEYELLDKVMQAYRPSVRPGDGPDGLVPVQDAEEADGCDAEADSAVTRAQLRVVG